MLDFEKELQVLRQEYRGVLAEKLEFLESLALKIENEKKSEDFEEFIREIHSIKGSAGSYGFDVVAYTFHKVEDYYAMKSDFANVVNDLGVFLNVLDLLRDYNNRNLKAEEDEANWSKKVDEVLGLGNENTHHVLIVEKVKLFRNLYSETLGSMGIEFSFADGGYLGLGRILHQKFDSIIITQESGLISGTKLAEILKVLDFEGPVYVTTSSGKLDETNSNYKILKKGPELESEIRSLYQGFSK